MRAWVERCPECHAIRYAKVLRKGDLVPYGAEIIPCEAARVQRWSHDLNCSRRKHLHAELLGLKTKGPAGEG